MLDVVCALSDSSLRLLPAFLVIQGCEWDERVACNVKLGSG